MFLTIAEFAEDQGISESTARRWLTKGLPSKIGPGGIAVIDPAEAEEWLDEQDEADEEIEEEEGDELEENEPDDEPGDDSDDDEPDDDEDVVADEEE